MWRLAGILRGLQIGFCLAAAGVAGAVTGELRLWVAVAMIVGGIVLIMWDSERLREYNREDRY